MVDALIRRAPKNPILFIGINLTIAFAWAGCIGAWTRAKHFKAEEGRYRVHWGKWIQDGDDIWRKEH
ncbi:hypothetical protein DPSP01_005838 [Paraphaeosphaeria sporulosa]|uniref:Uncharacterized protein n=1 Tax=Paraphaeosphaeria sporulosa TaxID=1460663 RepID=A0A177C9V4_9PLEO|nr:uncharacterized protein CC84DRAFT_1164901 [Paraphaeosphaeria sporulosa]OAG04433.1 hypothetical protein CC84DRAFT_1164901 [Paraphaeosphaeria sporulosa]